MLPEIISEYVNLVNMLRLLVLKIWNSNIYIEWVTDGF